MKSPSSTRRIFTWRSGPGETGKAPRLICAGRGRTSWADQPRRQRSIHDFRRLRPTADWASRAVAAKLFRGRGSAITTELRPTLPALSNPRQERFAQAAAGGAGNSEAYRAAGYTCRNAVSTRAAACRLRHLPDVDARIAEIQAQSAAEAEARGAASPAALTLELLQVAAEARALKSASGLATARAALMDAARLNGLLPDRKVGGAGSGAGGGRTHEDALADLEP